MGGYLMDSFVARERKAAMCMICKGYRPDIDIRFLTEELGFESDTDCVNFLCENEAADLIEQKSGDKGVPNSIRFQTAKALPLFERAKKLRLVRLISRVNYNSEIIRQSFTKSHFPIYQISLYRASNTLSSQTYSPFLRQRQQQ